MGARFVLYADMLKRTLEQTDSVSSKLLRLTQNP